MKLIDKIKNPSDLRKLPIDSLDKLADEIRNLIINVISVNGGHLASSLGAVELAISIHYSFDTPFDRLVWDVGHQAYAHKIICGRAQLFHTIRKYGGLSGFPDRSESIYDHFGAGHASTSISAALGIAEAINKNGLNNFSIAVIGDGALTGGLAFEALNHAGHIHAKNLIVVLNDNNMSIDPNVGALQRFLNQRMNITFYNRFRHELANVLKSLNSHGFFLKELISRVRKSIKMIFTPEMFYECLGFRYFGPVDGHNINELVKVFSSIKCNPPDGPYFIHTLTKKGKGFAPAERLPLKYHGISPFKVENGISVKTKNYQDIFAETLVELAQKNKRIIAITAAMPTGTGLNLFKEKFPDRFYDVGIAEEHAVTLAAGLATEGYQPVVAIYSTFLQRSFDQIIHDVALQNLPVIFAIDRAGLVGTDGITHQGQFDLSYMRVIPNITIMAPKDENELRHMIFTSLHFKKGPIAFRYPRGQISGIKLDKNLFKIPIGKGEILNADSEKSVNVALFAVGQTVKAALTAQTKLRQMGISSAVINPRFIKPLDEELIKKWALASDLFVTIEENSVIGGFGSAVLEYLHKESITKRALVIGIPDQFIKHGSQKLQRELLFLDANGILKKIVNELKINFIETRHINKNDLIYKSEFFLN